MRAGGSAALEAKSSELRVRELARQMEQEKARSASFRVASEAEERLGQTLAPLELAGWRVLVDRAWPGTRNGNVDFLLIGPGGVLVVDSKAWAEPSVVNDVLYRGEVDATDDVEKTLAVTELVEGARLRRSAWHRCSCIPCSSSTAAGCDNTGSGAFCCWATSTCSQRSPGCRLG